MLSRIRAIPLVFRWTFTALGTVALLGRWLAHQPPGLVTFAILRAAAAQCPSALSASRPIRISDGARTIDRWALARAMETLDGRDRCGRQGPAR